MVKYDKQEIMKTIYELQADSDGGVFVDEILQAMGLSDWELGPFSEFCAEMSREAYLVAIDGGVRYSLTREGKAQVEMLIM